ncbi:MAG: NAD(P)/FAD-dependent oxidoreductase [Candidatus Omnitrophota bacterium]|nr:MAG: NAD(P)/FAD-dependent oxidoreductase [Candidatus Omnitrophota bacterium]
MHELIIIGSGPIGCYLGQLLKKRGVSPVLIEEHKELGKPIHCAGLVGRKVFEETHIPLSSDCIINTINGAVIHLEDDVMHIRRKEVAYVIDREKFDKKLGENLTIHFETKFLGLEKEGARYIVETDKGDFEADTVIGADGAKSLVREFVSPNHMSYLKGVQFRMECKPHYSDMVEVYIEKPHFYWIIPEANNRIRIGVLSQTPYHDLLNFIKERKLEGTILEKFAGMVPLTHFAPISKERIFLIGDSASQLKPLTYGGIYMGMRGAEMLAECIARRDLAAYSPLWTKRFGRELGMALKARELFFRLTDDDVRRIFAFVKKRVAIIEERGDFENHASLVWEFLKDPGTSKEILNILFKIIKASLPNGL